MYIMGMETWIRKLPIWAKILLGIATVPISYATVQIIGVIIIVLFLEPL